MHYTYLLWAILCLWRRKEFYSFYHALPWVVCVFEWCVCMQQPGGVLPFSTTCSSYPAALPAFRCAIAITCSPSFPTHLLPEWCSACDLPNCLHIVPAFCLGGEHAGEGEGGGWGGGDGNWGGRSTTGIFNNIYYLLWLPVSTTCFPPTGRKVMTVNFPMMRGKCCWRGLLPAALAFLCLVCLL